MIARALVAGSCALLAAGFFVANSRASDRPTAAESEACRARGAGKLASPRLELRARAGVLRCDEDGPATRAFVGADRLIASLPPALRPGLVLVELRPSGSKLEAVPERSSLIISERYAAADPGTWLHEIAHLSAHGPRPRSLAARRVAAAIDEGVADYFAAALSRSPQVGSGVGEERDLRRPPPLRAEAWAMLALADFDPHRFGWALAALLWKAEPHAGALLEDCVRCLSGGALANAESPAAVLSALSRTCPERSRERLAVALRGWAPAELFEQPIREAPCASCSH